VVPVEPGAAPFHDWNERITAECYRPNGWARILDDHGRIVAIVDNYRRLSFDMGPTLLSWLEAHAPETYTRIVGADRIAGRAIAQGYGHAILPLCNDRDLRTQIRWGLADFRHRFGREAEGLWLPETAVDDRVLAALAEEGVGFTILAPTQIAAVRDPGGDWRPARAGDEARLPGTLRWRHPTHAHLGVDLVVYDGPVSHDVAFGGFPSQVVVDRIVKSAALRSALLALGTGKRAARPLLALEQVRTLARLRSLEKGPGADDGRVVAGAAIGALGLSFVLREAARRARGALPGPVVNAALAAGATWALAQAARRLDP
jgi:hypothetical protein